MERRAASTNLNFVASTPAAATFLKSIDCTDHIAEVSKKDAVYIAANVISVVDEFGAEDVIQVITDGEIKSTWLIITKEYSWIICSLCVDSACRGSCAKPQ